MKRDVSWLLAPLALILDRLTKLWAQSTLMGEGSLPIWPGVLRFIYVENTGAAFGLLKGRQLALLIVTGVALLALFLWLLFRARTVPPLARISMWLLLGGALGNFIDRLFLSYVVDFIEITLFPFPVFNISDICICVAFVLLSCWLLLSKEEKPDAG